MGSLPTATLLWLVLPPALLFIATIAAHRIWKEPKP